MKKLIFLLVAFLCITACEKEENGIPATSISLNKNKLYLSVGAKETLVATVEPANSTNTVKWASRDANIARVFMGEVTAITSGTTTIVATAGNVSAECEVIINSTPEGAVDMGLSVFWASCNLGAKQPPQSGAYYAWGETETKGRYDLKYYKWGDGSEVNGSQHMTKYNDTDGKTHLDLEDDAAHVILGGSWRIPTRAEMDELLEKCTWTWSSRRIEIGFGVYENEDIWGYEVTAANGNSIFIPAAGYRYDRLYDGQYCYLQTSTRNPERPDHSYRLDATRTYHWTEGYYREFGYPIRPVAD